MSSVVSVAVVRRSPPDVFIAEDIETLSWVLALKLVARTASDDIDDEVREGLRCALLEERWADAVVLWMKAVGVEVDVYSSEQLFGPSDVDFGPTELQFTPLFRD
jgi:hypothetical protein